MFSKICALLKRKPVEAKLPDFPVQIPVVKPKKELVKKATTRKPVAKKATVVAKKTPIKKKK